LIASFFKKGSLLAGPFGKCEWLERFPKKLFEVFFALSNEEASTPLQNFNDFVLQSF
jgi:hypothetical protein